MYNYISSIRKSSSIEQCIRCFFLKEEAPNLILSKNNILEINNLTKEGLLFNQEIIIYGKIILLLGFPSPNDNNKKKENIFILTELFDYCVLSYDNNTNKINTLFNGTIKEDFGKKQNNLLYSLDNDKNFLLISSYKNIFRLICLNTEKRFEQKYNDFIIKYKYENILFLSNFNVNFNMLDKNLKTEDKTEKTNILTFAVIKTDLITNNSNEQKKENNNSGEPNDNNIEKKHQIALETFQLKVEPNSFNIFYYEKKTELLNNKKNIALKATSNRKSNYKGNKDNDTKNTNKNSDKSTNKNTNENINVNNTHEKILEEMNLLQKLDISDNPTVSLIITHPDGLIILFFENYAVYYKYDITKKELIPKHDKKINYTDRKFINYTIIDEKNYKYFITDEYGNLFLLAFIDPFNIKQTNDQFILQILGEINYSTCLLYLDNNYIFNESNKSNSQLIKIQNRGDSLINVVKNYESLSPIKDFAIINNTEDENGIEILTISGVDKNCCIKKLKKGISVLFKGELRIKNIKNVFKLNIKNNNDKIDNNEIYSFIISTVTKSFIIDYNYKENIISLNEKLNVVDLVLFVENISDLIIIVTNQSILIYNNNLELITNHTIGNDKEGNNTINPLIIKYERKLNKLFMYLNNNILKSYTIEKNEKISEINEIFKNLYISAFDVCRYFIIYSLWDSNKLFIYSLNSKITKTINISDETLDYTKISSIQIFKNDLFYYIFISLSNGKLIYYKLKEPYHNYNSNSSYIFKEEDFIFKRKYNLNHEDFTISIIRQNSQNSLFINTQNPSILTFNKDTPNILYFNIKNCKNFIEITENFCLYIFNDKLSFGSLSNIQSQNIKSKFYGKQLNVIKLISFDVINNINELNKNIYYIITIEENKINNVFKNSFVLNDLNLKEISRYDFPNENEQSNSFTQINMNIGTGHKNTIDNKLFVVGTSIFENQSKESISGHLYLLEINQNNNYTIKKLMEIETKGGVYKLISCNNIIYVCIGNILYIYKLVQTLDNTYEFQLTKKSTEFTLINDIYLWKQSNTNNSKDVLNSNNYSNSNMHYLVISDLFRSIGIYSYDIKENKLLEICRDYKSTWVYSSCQLDNNLLYLTDIEGNILTLKKNNNPIKENDEIKMERIAFYNYGERINSMFVTKIKNKDLYKISHEDITNNAKNTINDSYEVKIVFFSSLEGSVGLIIQINEEIFNFLKKLQNLLVKNQTNYGGFNYDKWKNYNNGIINLESKGFIEGDIFEKFLNNDEMYKKKIIKELNYPWNKSYHDAIHILEALTNTH